MNKRVEFSTLVGIVLAIVLIFLAIVSSENGKIAAFIDLPSVLIVVAGTFFITCAAFTIADVFKTFLVTSQTLVYTHANKKKSATIFIALAEQAKKEGILSLQNFDRKHRGLHSFFKKHLTLIVDGLDAEEAEKLMSQEILSLRERHKKSVDILKKAAEIAPSMGLIGTLIGLVQMLSNLEDPGSIGPAMAIALLTTLYGAFIAYVILTPLASKLERNSKQEAEVLKMYGEAAIAIAKRESPIKLEMVLNSNLSPSERVRIHS